jgi:triosephosphate isomerase
MYTVVANWKMEPPTGKDAKRLFDATKKAAAPYKKRVQVVIAPPSLYLREFARSGRGIALAAQDGRAEHGGAHTGELSLVQMKDAGARYVILGHAERRAMGESDASVGTKAAAAITLGLSPVVCVGERIRDDHGTHFETVRAQLRAAFADIPAAKAASILVAYEPVWAIGGVHPMAPASMHEMHIFIRKTLAELYADVPRAPKLPPVLYGGAIDETSAADMIRGSDVAGLLVGHASLDTKGFSRLIAAVAGV